MRCRYKIAILMALVFITVTAASRANCQEDKRSDPESPVVKGLQLSVELLGDELFRPREHITIKFKLKNTSKSPVYIHKQLGFGAGGFRLTISDANDRWVPPNMIRENFPPPVESKDDLQAIEPGKSIEQQIQIPLDFYQIVPGDYTLRLRYVSPVAADSILDGLTVLTSDDAALVAKPIRFKVLHEPSGL